MQTFYGNFIKNVFDLIRNYGFLHLFSLINYFPRIRDVLVFVMVVVFLTLPKIEVPAERIAIDSQTHHPKYTE